MAKVCCDLAGMTLMHCRRYDLVGDLQTLSSWCCENREVLPLDCLPFSHQT